LFRATILYSQEIPPDLAAIMRARYVQGKRMVELQNDFGLSDARVWRRVRDGGFFLAGASLRAAGHPQLGALLVACGVTKTRRIVESERVLCFGRAKDASPR